MLTPPIPRLFSFRCDGQVGIAAHAASATLDVSEAFGTAAHATAITPGEVPEWVHLIPAGTLGTRDGRGASGGPWRLVDAAAVIAASNDYHAGQPAPIDYDHQLEYTEKNGAGAPAAGWITALDARPDGIWGKVDWTAAAQEKLKAKEYRYLSPVFAYAKSGEILALLRAGLTNKPNLALTAINSTTTQDPHMTQMSAAARQRLMARLGLPETSDDDAILACVNSIVESEELHRNGLGTLRGTLKLAATSTPDEILVAAQASAVVDPSKHVPFAAHSAVVTELNTLKKAEGERVVDAAMAAGKIIPANRDWAIGYQSADPTAFAAFIDRQPKVIDATRETRDQGTGRAAGKLADADKAVCAVLQIEEADFLKNIDKES